MGNQHRRPMDVEWKRLVYTQYQPCRDRWVVWKGPSKSSPLDEWTTSVVDVRSDLDRYRCLLFRWKLLGCQQSKASTYATDTQCNDSMDLSIMERGSNRSKSVGSYRGQQSDRLFKPRIGTLSRGCTRLFRVSAYGSLSSVVCDLEAN